MDPALPNRIKGKWPKSLEAVSQDSGWSVSCSGSGESMARRAQATISAGRKRAESERSETLLSKTHLVSGPKASESHHVPSFSFIFTNFHSFSFISICFIDECSMWPYAFHIDLSFTQSPGSMMPSRPRRTSRPAFAPSASYSCEATRSRCFEAFRGLLSLQIKAILGLTILFMIPFSWP